MNAKTRCTRALSLQGLVQGQGVRPTVARLAAELNLLGTVRNTMRGVEVHVCGVEEQLEVFESRLKAQLSVEVTHGSSPAVHLSSQSGFRILPSEQGAMVATAVPVDLAVCSDCLVEIRSSSSRRFQYPFTSCTRCGPRYSIVREMPFDREQTSMAPFALCNACQSEYLDSGDRRFHAQTNACPECGPQCWCTDRDGFVLARANDAILEVANAIAAGKIVALKGLGGYQLICDATDDRAVRLLRDRKGRPTKPLPIMLPDIDHACRQALISHQDHQQLASSVGPIVLVRAASDTNLSALLHPGLRDIGIMLPTTPLHALLCDLLKNPMVVTSGNAHGAPIVFRNDAAMEQLQMIADIWLHHDRLIERPVDDSVIRCIGDRAMTIRVGRGLAPMTVPAESSQTTIAFGGHQKVALALATRYDRILAPHIGDMDSESSRQRLIDQQCQLAQLYRISPQQVACDQHPNYFTTSLANDGERATFSVQHHHAHVATAILEHGLRSDTVLGFAFDGTGYGSDGTVWGGEVLLATIGGFERVAHLKPFQLPAGDVSIGQPWRTAITIISQACDQASCDRWLRHFDLEDQPSNIRFTTSRGIQTTSMGRLFDAVAAMILPIKSSHYEGEAAMLLESACDESETSAYSFDLAGNQPIHMDWRQLIRRIGTDHGVMSPGKIAMKFHRAVANVVVEVAGRFRQYPAVVCGGVFQNRVLLELIDQRASERGIEFRFPGRIPTNDGGLALGQLLVATSNSQSSHWTTESTGNHHEVRSECV